MSESTQSDQDAMAAEWAATMGEQVPSGTEIDVADILASATGSVQKMPSASSSEPPSALVISGETPANLDVVLDISVRISMEVGNTEIPIRQLLKLTRGSIVELSRLAGEPLDVLVNGTLIAHGEVVVVNEKFGIRLTDVLSPAERIRQLR